MVLDQRGPGLSRCPETNPGRLRMKQRRLGGAEAVGFGIGTGLHGDVEDSTGPVMKRSPSLPSTARFGAGNQLPGHTADMYGPYKNELLVGRAVRRASQRGRSWPRSSASCAIPPIPVFRGAAAGRSTCARMRGKPAAAAAWRRSTSTISTASIPKSRSKRPSARWPTGPGRQGPLPRSLGGRREDHPPRARGPSDRRAADASTRSGRATRRRRFCRPAASSGFGFVAYSPLGRGFLSREDTRTSTIFAPEDLRRVSPRFQGENFQRNLDLVERVRSIAS